MNAAFRTNVPFKSPTKIHAGSVTLTSLGRIMTNSTDDATINAVESIGSGAAVPSDATYAAIGSNRRSARGTVSRGCEVRLSDSRRLCERT